MAFLKLKASTWKRKSAARLVWCPACLRWGGPKCPAPNYGIRRFELAEVACPLHVLVAAVEATLDQ